MKRYLLVILNIVSCYAWGEDKNFVIVIPSFNNVMNQFEGDPVFKKNLDSVYCQIYPNYRVIIVDDNSDDGTGNAIENYIQELGQEYRTLLIKNEKQEAQLANRYKAISMCQDKEIVILLDGDDWLAHDQVLGELNEIYSDKNVWMTYGQFVEYCPSCLKIDFPFFYKKSKNCKHDGHFCTPLPNKEVINKNEWREFIQKLQFKKHGTGWMFGHLYTFYAKLFGHIKVEDLKDQQGNFYNRSTDVAIMVPLAELAGHHIFFNRNISYIYNRDTIVKSSLPTRRYSYRKKTKYQPLKKLF